MFDVNVLKGEVAYPFVLQWEQYKLVRAALEEARKRIRMSKCASRPV